MDKKRNKKKLGIAISALSLSLFGSLMITSSTSHQYQTQSNILTNANTITPVSDDTSTWANTRSLYFWSSSGIACPPWNYPTFTLQGDYFQDSDDHGPNWANGWPTKGFQWNFTSSDHPGVKYMKEECGYPGTLDEWTSQFSNGTSIKEWWCKYYPTTSNIIFGVDSNKKIFHRFYKISESELAYQWGYYESVLGLQSYDFSEIMILKFNLAPSSLDNSPLDVKTANLTAQDKTAIQTSPIIKQLIADRIAVTHHTAEDINITSVTNNDYFSGTARVHFTVKNWVNANSMEPVTSSEQEISLFNFNTPTTSIEKNKELTVPGLDKRFAYEFSNNEGIFEELKPKILQAIYQAKIIHDAQDLKPEDIDIINMNNVSIVDGDVNAVDVVVAIKNNKAWKNGTSLFVQNFTDSPIRIKGFLPCPPDATRIKEGATDEVIRIVKTISDVLPVLKNQPHKITEIKNELTRQLPLGLRDSLFENLLSTTDVQIGDPKIIEGNAPIASAIKSTPSSMQQLAQANAESSTPASAMAKEITSDADLPPEYAIMAALAPNDFPDITYGGGSGKYQGFSDKNGNLKKKTWTASEFWGTSDINGFEVPNGGISHDSASWYNKWRAHTDILKDGWDSRAMRLSAHEDWAPQWNYLFGSRAIELRVMERHETWVRLRYASRFYKSMTAGTKNGERVYGVEIVIEGLTPSTKMYDKTLSNVKTIYDTPDEDLKRAIIRSGAITNTYHNATIYPGDLSVQILERNQSTNSIKCNVTIKGGKSTGENSGASVSERVFRNLTFYGFDSYKTTSIKNPIDVDSLGISPTKEGILSREEDIRQAIVNNISGTAAHLIRPSDVKINNIISIEPKKGEGVINVTINNWRDSSYNDIRNTIDITLVGLRFERPHSLDVPVTVTQWNSGTGVPYSNTVHFYVPLRMAYEYILDKPLTLDLSHVVPTTNATDTAFDLSGQTHIDQTSIENMIKHEIANYIISNPVTTYEDLTITKVKPNYFAGSAEVTVSVPEWIYNDGRIESRELVATINGFKQLTTHLEGADQLIDVPELKNVTRSELANSTILQNYNAAIAKAIYQANIIKDADPKLTATDIRITHFDAATGMITFDIIHDKAGAQGEIKNPMTFDKILIGGFQTDAAASTNWKDAAQEELIKVVKTFSNGLVVSQVQAQLDAITQQLNTQATDHTFVEALLSNANNWGRWAQVSFSNLRIQNRQLLIDAQVADWYNGVDFVNQTKTFAIDLQGNTSITIPESGIGLSAYLGDIAISNNTADDTLHALDPTQQTQLEDNLKLAIAKHIQGLDESVSLDDLTISQVRPNMWDGSAVVNITIPHWVDENGKEEPFHTVTDVTITGFRQPATNLDVSSALVVPTLKDTYPHELTNADTLSTHHQAIFDALMASGKLKDVNPEITANDVTFVFHEDTLQIDVTIKHEMAGGEGHALDSLTLSHLPISGFKPETTDASQVQEQALATLTTIVHAVSDFEGVLNAPGKMEEIKTRLDTALTNDDLANQLFAHISVNGYLSIVTFALPTLDTTNHQVAITATITNWFDGHGHYAEHHETFLVGINSVSEIDTSKPINPNLPDISVTVTPDGHLEVVEGDKTPEEVTGQIIDSIVGGITGSNKPRPEDVTIENIRPDIFEGNITVDVIVPEWVLPDGTIEKPHKIENVVIEGFKQQTTTLDPSKQPLMIDALKDIYIHELTFSEMFTTKQDAIIEAIYNSGVVLATQPGFSINDIQIENFNEATSTIDVVILNGKGGAEGHVINPYRLPGLQIAGFKPNTNDPTQVHPQALEYLTQEVHAVGKYHGAFTSQKLVALQQTLQTKINDQGFGNQLFINLNANGHPSTLTVAPLTITTNADGEHVLEIPIQVTNFFDGSQYKEHQEIFKVVLQNAHTFIPDTIEVDYRNRIVDDDGDGHMLIAGEGPNLSVILANISERIAAQIEGDTLVSGENVTITNVRANTFAGTIVVDAVVNNWIQDDGNIDSHHVLKDITISGFKQPQTSLKTNTVVKVKGIEKVYMNQMKDDDILTRYKDQLLTAVFNQGVILDAAPSLQLDNLDLEYDGELGTFTVVIKNHKAGSAGVAQPEVKLTGLHIQGFNETGLTTYKITNVVDVSAGLGDHYAFELKDNMDAMETLKNIIIQANTFDGLTNGIKCQELKPTDLEITIKEDTLDNFNGSFHADVTILGNKAWEKGKEVARKTFDLNIDGFKTLTRSVSDFSTLDLNTMKSAIWGEDGFYTMDWEDAAHAESIKTTLFNYINTHLQTFIKNPLINTMYAKVQKVDFKIVNHVAHISVTYDDVVLTPGGFSHLNADGTLSGVSTTINYQVDLFPVPTFDVNEMLDQKEIIDLIYNTNITNHEAAMKDYVYEKIVHHLTTTPHALPQKLTPQINDILATNTTTIKGAIHYDAQTHQLSIDHFTAGPISFLGTTRSLHQYLQTTTQFQWWILWLLIAILATLIVCFIAFRMRYRYDQRKNTKNQNTPDENSSQEPAL